MGVHAMSSANTSPTLESACTLAAQGVAIHWLREKSKAPLMAEWSTKPFNPPAGLRATYTDGVNVGIRLGKWSKVGDLFLHGIDMDVRVADKAEEAWARLKQILPEFATLPFVISGSGGASRHFYFLTDRPFPSRKIVSSPDKFTDESGKQHSEWEIELFGTGKQLACPPSIHPSGKPYVWGCTIDFYAIEIGLGPVVAAETVQGWGVSSSEITEEEDELAAEVHRAPLDLDDEEVHAILARLPLDQFCEDREGWVKVGMALHHQYEGSDEGRDLWNAFSSKSKKYEAKEQRRAWESFKSKPNPTTMRSLIQVVGSKKADNDLVIDGYPLTEDGMALAFANRFKDKLKFCHTSGRWYVWTGTHWKREETHLAFEWVRTTCRKHAEMADSKSAAVKALSRAATATAVEKFARVDRVFAVTAEVWDSDPWLLGTPTGTVELKTTGRLRPAHPKDMITRLTVAGPIPLESFAPERDCPRWLAFLRQALNGDAEAIRFFQRWVGYCLTGNTDLQALLFVHGEGGTGKSTAINTIGDLLGDYCVNVEPETLVATKFDRHSTELARLHGPRMARSTETKQGTAWHESRIKALTGGDVVTARFMRQDNFEYRPQFKVNVVGNHTPRIVNCDEAMRRRFNVLPFNVKPTVRDLTLANTLKAEGPGILSWGIVGCLDLQANGLLRPAVVRVATDAYFADQDIFAQWLEQECELGKDYVETNERVWESWMRFASLCGEDPGNRNKSFPARLIAKGFEPIKDTAGIRGRGFKGIRVIENNGFDDLSDDDDLVG